MNKKHWLVSKACVVKTVTRDLVSLIAHFIETLWVIGAGVAAAMVISTSTHLEGRPLSPSVDLLGYRVMGVDFHAEDPEPRRS